MCDIYRFLDMADVAQLQCADDCEKSGQYIFYNSTLGKSLCVDECPKNY